MLHIVKTAQSRRLHDWSIPNTPRSEKKPGEVCMHSATAMTTIRGMTSTLRSRIESASPAVPATPGHLAWILARAEQMLGIVRTETSASVGELWVQLHPDTLARVAAECVDLTADPLPGVSAMTPLRIDDLDMVMYLVADPDLDRATMSISFGETTADVEIAASAVLGFVHPAPMPVAEIETRWVLQHDDGMDGERAETVSKLL